MPKLKVLVPEFFCTCCGRVCLNLFLLALSGNDNTSTKTTQRSAEQLKLCPSYPGKLCNSSSLRRTAWGLEGTTTPQKLNSTAFFFFILSSISSSEPEREKPRSLWLQEFVPRAAAGSFCAGVRGKLWPLNTLTRAGPPTDFKETHLLYSSCK